MLLKKIVVAEDDDAIAHLVNMALGDAGFLCLRARDGAEAINLVRVHAPDLLVLDVMMPRVSGHEVARKIKGDVILSRTPILMLTALSSVNDKVDGFDAGADDYLAKPFDTRELLARVAALLRLAQRGLDRNPTSGLPGGDAIYQELDRRRGLAKPFAVAYFDLDHFKPFSDRFGFAVADAAIREAADALTLAAKSEPGAFVGHVGGDDFVLCCEAGSGRRLAENAQRRFAAGLLDHLPRDVAERGTYRGRDRSGDEQEFPVTRLSAAVLRIDPARWPDFGALSERVAELKRQAKAEQGGGLVEAEA